MDSNISVTSPVIPCIKLIRIMTEANADDDAQHGEERAHFAAGQGF